MCSSHEPSGNDQAARGCCFSDKRPPAIELVNQVFGVAAPRLLRFSNALEIADKVVVLSVNRRRNRIELVSHLAHRPAQKAGRGSSSDCAYCPPLNNGTT